MLDLIIVGAGTAGLSAAIYATRAGLSTLVIERAMYGGQITVSPEVDNYPGIPHTSGAELAQSMYQQAEDLGAQFAFETVESVEEEGGVYTVRTDAGTHTAPALILATGAQNRPLGLAEEQSFTGRGVSYCATCDGMFFKDRPVAVVGGGNTALEDAEVLAGICSTVYLVHRRDQFRGEHAQVERLRTHSNVEFVLDSVVTALEGENKLTAAVVENCKTGEVRRLEVDGLFVAVGQIPQNQPFAHLAETDAQGYIKAGEDCRTSRPGLFVAGDGRTKTVRQLVTAAADGAVAALGAAEYLRSR